MSDNNTTDSGNVILLHPQFEKLKAEIEKFRVELTMLVLERDELLFIECKNIEMAYMLSVGALEYKVYEVECAILRLKRKIELIQARKNRQEKIVLSVIEDTLDSEFAEYQAKLDEQINKMNTLLERSRGRSMTKEENSELKKLYRAIVKALHPDLHPNLGDAKIKLFHNAIKAYENGDLNVLRIIAAMVSEMVIPAQKSEGLAFLRKEKERFIELLQSIKDSIAKIKSEYPYTMKPLVQNPKKMEARKTELESHIEQLNEVLSAYEAKIAEMLR